MENRDRIIQEYFQLRVLLNRPNKLADQISKLKFEIKHTNQGALQLWTNISTSTESHGIILATKIPNLRWISAGFSGLYDFEDFCCEILQRRSDNTNLQLLAEDLIQELSSLGI